MKKALISMTFLLSVIVGTAQVGIGVTGSVNSSAKLQVDASDKGFLPPRVGLTATNASSPINSPVEGLLVYNTNTAGTGATAVTPGFYYYSGTAWVRLIVPTDNAANVTGTVAITNGGTGAATANGALNSLLPAQTGNANKVLVTDGTNTSWTTNVALTSSVIGTISNSPANLGSSSSTGSYIDLPKGKWSVQVTMMARASSSSMTGSFWIRTFFSEGTDNGTSTDDCVGPNLVSSLIQGAAKYNMVIGTLIINNTYNGTVRYWYRTSDFVAYDGGDASGLRLENFGKSNWGENSIVAYPMN